MSRPPRRPLRRTLALGLLGTLLAWWGWNASAPGPGRPPAIAPRPPADLPQPAPRGGEHTLVGVVRDGNGAALGNVLITAVSDGRIQTSLSSPDGSFALTELVAGDLLVSAVAIDRAPTQVSVPVPTETPLEVTMEPPFEDAPRLEPVRFGELVGTVTLPLPEDRPEGMEVLLVPLVERGEFLPLDGRVEQRAAVDEKGAFAFSEVALGRYEVLLLSAHARGGRWPVLSRVSHEQRPGDGPQTLSIAATSGAVEAVVLDTLGRPVEGALVELSDTSAPGRVFPHTRTDSLGRFRIGAVPPGTWRLSIAAGAAQEERLVRVSALRTERPELAPLALSAGP